MTFQYYKISNEDSSYLLFYKNFISLKISLDYLSIPIKFLRIFLKQGVEKSSSLEYFLILSNYQIIFTIKHIEFYSFLLQITKWRSHVH